MCLCVYVHVWERFLRKHIGINLCWGWKPCILNNLLYEPHLFFVWSFLCLDKTCSLWLPYASWKRVKCQLYLFFQDDRLTFNYLYHLGTRKYQLQTTGQQFLSCNFLFKLFSQVNSKSSEILENLEYTFVQITLLRNGFILTKSLTVKYFYPSSSNNIWF